MIVASEILKRLFIWGVTAVAVVPRQHIDNNRCCSIGGSLSYSFKKLLLGMVAINFVRLLLKDSSVKGHSVLLRDILGVLQQLGHTFLCFLSPYLLQTWLANIVNIGGRPGSNLTPVLMLSIGLSILASILARNMSDRFWALRKVGNAISVMPVVQTLKIYNSVTTRGGNHEGRGTILSQTLMTVEQWYALGQVLAVIGFSMNRHGDEGKTQLDEILSAFRGISFILDWTRILCHAIFINQLDELYLASPQSNTNTNSSDRTTGEEDEPGYGASAKYDDTQLMVPLVKRNMRV